MFRGIYAVLVFIKNRQNETSMQKISKEFGYLISQKKSYLRMKISGGMLFFPTNCDAFSLAIADGNGYGVILLCNRKTDFCSKF